MSKVQLYIGFSKPKNRVPVIGYLFSWAIRAVERTPYSHAYVRWYSRGAQVDVVYQASGTKVHFSSKKKVFDHYVEPVKEYVTEIDMDAYKKGLHFAMSNAAVDYGLKGAVGIAWVYAGKLLGKTWRNPWIDGDYSWFCNELVAAFYQAVKETDLGIDIESVGPKGLDEALSKRPDVKLVFERQSK